MSPRVKVLKQLVRDRHYIIDEAAVAEAMMLRSTARRMLPDVTFRSTPRSAPQVRSFRPHRGVRSFRLSRSERRPLHVRHGDLKPIA